MGDHEDPALLALVASGDLGALRMLYDRHAPWLAARLSRRCNDPEVVADVLQDAFVGIWRGADSWRGDGEPAAWLWGIAARLPRVPAAPAPARGRAAAGRDPGARAEMSAEEQVLLGVEYGDLGSALRRLSPQMRAVVQATVLDGLTTREAARLLGIPENTVKTRLHRAKAQLRGHLAAEGLR